MKESKSEREREREREQYFPDLSSSRLLKFNFDGSFLDNTRKNYRKT